MDNCLVVSVVGAGSDGAVTVVGDVVGDVVGAAGGTGCTTGTEGRCGLEVGCVVGAAGKGRGLL